MATTIPTTGPVSMKQIREYIGLNNTVHLSSATNPLSLRQIFYSPINTTNLNTYPYFALSSLRGCKFASYVNSARSLEAGKDIRNQIDGVQSLWFGLSNPVQNAGYGQSGLLYTRNLGLPIKLHIQATSGNLNSLNLDTYSRANNTFNYYSCGSQGGASFEIVNDLHQIRLYTDPDSASQFLIRIIPMLDGGTEGTGEHVINMVLIFIEREESSFEGPIRR